MQIFQGHRGSVNSLDFSPDGTRLVSGGNDKIIRNWDTTSPGSIIQSPELNGRVSQVAFASEEQVVILMQHGKMHRRDASDLSLAKRIGSFSYVREEIALAPRTRLLAAVGWENKAGSYLVRVWANKAGKWETVYKENLPNNNTATYALAFDPTGTLLLTGAGIVDLQSGKRLLKSKFECYRVRWSPDGKWLIETGWNSNWIWVRDGQTGERVTKLELERKAVLDTKFSPCGGYLAAVSNEGIVRIWATRSWKPCSGFAWDIGKLKCITFSPDGQRAACGSHQGTILIWDWDL